MFLKKHRAGLFFVLIALALLALALGLCFGAVEVPLSVLWQGDTEAATFRILWHVRLPRVLAAFLAGGALAVAGVLLQGVLHNPLAGPNIIGVNAGAGLGAVLAMTLFPGVAAAVPAAAFLFALLCALLILALAAKGGLGRVTVVLAGVAVSRVFSAGIDALKTFLPQLALDANGFLTGSFAGVSAARLWPAALFIVVGLAAAFFAARALDVLALGDESAAALGLSVPLARLLLLALAAWLAGAAVSVAGLLGFVGLLVPHILRPLCGRNHRTLLPAAALSGGSFVVLCDLFGRVAFAPYEVPVGIFLSFLGGPFFLFLLLRKRGERPWS